MESSGAGYFLYHSIGLYPGKAEEMAAALASFSGIWGACDDAQWPKVLRARAEFVKLWEGVIDAPAGSLTTCESVTAGLYSVLGALPPERLRGKRLLVAADCFPSLHFLLSGLQERLGFTLDTVPLRDGETWVREEDMLARLGPDVALTLVTLVTSTASYRADLGRLLPAIRAAGSMSVLDLTQGVGIVPFSAADHTPDIVVSTSLKWLCGAPGAGILHVRPDLLDECRPDLRGWFSQPDPFSWDLDGFDYAPDIRRFDNGTPGVIAAAGSVPALERLLADGMDARLAQNRALSARIVDALDAVGVPLASPRDADRRGGSVMADMGTPVTAASAVAVLREAGIFADARGRILRMSPGIVTGEGCLDSLPDFLTQARGQVDA